MVRISGVEPGSQAASAGIAAGDVLLSVNGREISDVFDYRFAITEEALSLCLMRGGERYTCRVQKAQYDDLGLEFDSFLMDAQRVCENACVFCFIDQNPPGMRESVYFKDDDTRLSFLHGNYVTLTNCDERALRRLAELRLSPVNVSVHTTDPALRVQLLQNARAGEIMAQLNFLAEKGILLNCQIVLCRGINDGAALQRTLGDLRGLYPALQSVAVVPAGLTRYREHLAPLESYDEKSAGEVIDCVEAFAADCKARLGTRLCFCADELYVRAKRPLPPCADYEGYPQLENGVGLLRSMEEDVLSALRKKRGGSAAPHRFTLATGLCAAPFMEALTARILKGSPQTACEVVPVKNGFYGESVTVAGLLCGADYLTALRGRALGQTLLIAASSLRYERDLFLDGMRVEALSEALGIPVVPVENGADMVEVLWKGGA